MKKFVKLSLKIFYKLENSMVEILTILLISIFLNLWGKNSIAITLLLFVSSTHQSFFCIPSTAPGAEVGKITKTVPFTPDGSIGKVGAIVTADLIDALVCAWHGAVAVSHI